LDEGNLTVERNCPPLATDLNRRCDRFHPTKEAHAMTIVGSQDRTAIILIQP
jgi:hypothetical protein